MPVDVRWLEPRILLFRVQQPFTTQALNRAIDTGLDLVSTVPGQPVGTVLDTSGVLFVPPGSLQKGRKLAQVDPANIGPVVLIRPNPVIRGFTRLARSVHPPTADLIHVADDQQSAVVLLRRLLGMDA